jgi:hypothetical protein
LIDTGAHEIPLLILTALFPNPHEIASHLKWVLSVGYGVSGVGVVQPTDSDTACLINLMHHHPNFNLKGISFA